MHAHRTAAFHPTPILPAREPESPWAAMAFAEDVPPSTLDEARAGRTALVRLLAREHAATADFLLALADFDRRRAWERLGHASLFAFLTRELGLSAGAAQLRLSAARLLPRHPAVEVALRAGRLCISAVGQLARVLTPENEAAVLPRFLGRSAREATEVAAALVPQATPPVRVVVTAVARPADALVGLPFLPRSCASPASRSSEAPAASGAGSPGEPALHTYEVAPPRPVRPLAPAVEPLTADLRRLHLTVSKGFLDKVAEARTGLSHAVPGATTEQALEAALDLLLERQARAKALVKRPRAAPRAKAEASVERPQPSRHRPHVPAPLEREVRLRDGNRCAFPIDGGGVCGSTLRVELDHLVPLALGGVTTAPNLRCLCKAHHRRESERLLGAAARARWPRAGP